MQARGGGKLVHPALRPLDLEPAQEAAHRRPVARLRIAVTGLFGPVLDRLGKDRRIGLEGDVRAARLQRQRDSGDREIGIDGDALAGEFAQRTREGPAIPDRHGIAEMAGQFRRDLLGGDEQLGAAILRATT